MKKRLLPSFAIFFALILFATPLMSLTVSAVQTLPDNFLIVDSNGIQINDETPYMVHIEDMQVGERYEETIFLQNLETDYYNLYFRTRPLESTGDVDLFEYSRIQLYLDGELFYEGSPSGIGNIDMQQEAFLIGSFAVGETKILKVHAEIPEESWPGSEEYCVILFEWIFNAEKVVDSPYDPGTPKGSEKPAQPPVTGVIVRTVLLTIIFLLIVIILLILSYSWKLLRGSQHYIIVQPSQQ